jgi:hypothetical protein
VPLLVSFVASAKFPACSFLGHEFGSRLLLVAPDRTDCYLLALLDVFSSSTFTTHSRSDFSLAIDSPPWLTKPVKIARFLWFTIKPLWLDFENQLIFYKNRSYLL